MKLINCYIDNFGTLSNYSVDFDEKLTVLKEPNGFGKTTLATFLLVMFYGMPRKKKLLEKDLRKKYDPWQGGRYGGTLTIKLDGREYRIERTFGKRPADDTFDVFDARTNERDKILSSYKSLGDELFHLDSDSFSRCIYIPQVKEDGKLATSSIKTKLGNLIENSGDLEEYDEAIDRLKKRRTYYEAYRGNGGKLNEITTAIEELQGELIRHEGDKDRVSKAVEDLKRCNIEIVVVQIKQFLIQQRLSAHADAVNAAELETKYNDLVAKQRDLEEKIKSIQSCYEGSLPLRREIDELSTAITDKRAFERAKSAEINLTDSQDIVRQYQPLFSSIQPSESEIAEKKAIAVNLVATKAKLNEAVMSQEDKAELADLESFFENGVPTPQTLEACAEAIGNLSQLQAKQNNMSLSEDERYSLESLKQRFAQGLPSNSVFSKINNSVEELRDLKSRNKALQQTISASNAKSDKKQGNGLKAALIVIGLLCMVAGAVVFAFVDSMVVCAALVVVGVALVISAFIFGGRKGASATSDSQTVFQNEMNNNEERIGQLEASIKEFIAQYKGNPNVDEKLAIEEIARDAWKYQSLLEKQSRVQQFEDFSTTETKGLEEKIVGFLDPYFDKPFSDYSARLQQVRMNLNRLISLRSQKESISSKAKQLADEYKKGKESLDSYLSQFSISVVEDDTYSSVLSTLENQYAKYKSAKGILKNASVEFQERSESLRNATSLIDSFAKKYKVSASVLTPEYVNAAYLDLANVKRNEDALNKVRLSVDDFIGNHGKPPYETKALLSNSESEDLQSSLRILDKRSKDLRSSLATYEIELSEAKRCADKGIELEDEYETLIEERKNLRHRVELLEKTISYLQKSQKELSASYIGPLEQYFKSYADKFSNVSGLNVMMDQELGVSVNYHGSYKELSYFSAGYNDMFDLCMRMALVDALFEGERPFVIMDDPFVNLDDEHTKEALEFLMAVSKDKQVVYLVCNSSRMDDALNQAK